MKACKLFKLVKIMTFLLISQIRYIYVIGILTARYRKISFCEPKYESLQRVSVANDPKDSYSCQLDDILKYLSVQNSEN